MKYLALINENSGTVLKVGPENIAEIVNRIIGADGVSTDDGDSTGHDVEIIIGDGETLISAARDAADEADVIICAGGDGTQAGVAGAIGGRKAALLPLPCGTMNLLCRDLGIPLDIEQALQTALHAPKIKIDIGVVGDRTFLNNVVFGSYAELAEAREELREIESVESLGEAIVGAANALVHADPLRFTIDLDDERIDAKTNTVVVSINRITSSENLVPRRDRLEAGELIVYLTESKNGVDLAGVILEFLRGGVEQSEKIDGRPCQRCRIDGRRRKVSYTIDGDPLESSAPVELRIEKKSLAVHFPAAAITNAAE